MNIEFYFISHPSEIPDIYFYIYSQDEDNSNSLPNEGGQYKDPNGECENKHISDSMADKNNTTDQRITTNCSTENENIDSMDKVDGGGNYYFLLHSNLIF